MAWEPDYVTVPELKSYLRVDDDQDDTLVAVWATTASRAVDTHCHRQFGQVDDVEERDYSGRYDVCAGTVVYEIDDLMDVTGMVVRAAGEVLAAEYVLWPRNAPQRGRPFTQLRTVASGPLVVEASWGWSAVPTAVKNATLIQAARFAARRDSPYGIAGSPSEGSEQRLLATLDPDLKTALGSKYRREWWVA